MPNSVEQLQQRIVDRSAVVGVVGLGYVGLPFAVEKAKMGFRVLAIDLNLDRVQQVNAGENYIGDVDSDDLKRLVAEGLIVAVSDYARLPEVDVVVICVPTPLTINLAPDLRYVVSVTESLVPHLRAGQLVSLESTTYPGTTEEVMQPILERSGLVIDQDLFLAHSPERVDPGNRKFTTKNTTKVVGAVGPNSLAVAKSFYSETIETVVTVSTAKAAEMVKVFENTFRSVNIALVNELTMLCDRMNVDVWEVLDAAFTKPFGIMPFYPGPGVGGHCIPIDPHYLEWKAREYNFATHFIALAGEINRRMPEYAKNRALRILGRAGVPQAGANVLVLGVAYKKDIDDYRESPAMEVLELLISEGMNVSYHDSFVPEIPTSKGNAQSVELTENLLRSMDLVVITTAHSTVDYDFVTSNSLRIFDTRNATKNVNMSKVDLDAKRVLL